MGIAEFKSARDKHDSYSQDGALNPAAPEYTIGDVLSGSLYRVLVLGMHDQRIDLEQLSALPSKFLLDDQQAWSYILFKAIKSPSRGQSSYDDIIPLVPRLAAHGAVLGAQRKRWLPGKLALAAIGAGSKGNPTPRFEQLRAALSVDTSDEIAARYLETSLQSRDDLGPLPASQPALLANPPPSYWRATSREYRTPGERLALDIDALIEVKSVLPRYQWHVLFQSILRLGVSCYQLWLCMMHEMVWDAACSIVDDGDEVASQDEIEQVWCEAHATGRPLLELDEDASRAMRAQIARYAVARTGINLVLHALDDCGAKWSDPLAGDSTASISPSASVVQFLQHVHAHRAGIAKAIQSSLGSNLRKSAAAKADADPAYVSAANSGGPTKGMWEFVRYTLGQVTRRKDEHEVFDQAYFTSPKNNSRGADQLVRPGSTTLVALSVCTSQSNSGLPASMQDLSTHLREYGVYAPLGSLSSGYIGRQLEQLGLVVDTPDAGGGRLLLNPFARSSTKAR